MLLAIFLGLLLFSPLVFLVNKKSKFFIALLPLLAGMAVSGFLAINVLTTHEVYSEKLSLLYMGSSSIVIDGLSAFFMLLVNIAAIIAIWYTKGYLKDQLPTKSSNQLSLHYLAYVLLYLSMILVLMFRDAFSFLFVWELMTCAVLVLAVFDGHQRNKLGAAISYVVQMHLGFFVLVAAFTLVKMYTGSFSFDALPTYFADNKNLPVFLLFFIGFGMKAGFVPLHTWLPDFYFNAPANVVGFLSSAVSKMGLYGLMRVAGFVQSDFFEIALLILALSILSGLFGIILSVVQKDIKRLLAYSSIENVGIIGIGIGLAMLGKAYNNELLAICGFAGALLHTFNHSIIKSLLFHSASSLCTEAGTQNMELMGGVSKKMPYTSAFFLTGSLAICALPPFNAFMSEFIIYSGLFKSLANSDSVGIAILMVSIVSLALIGGLSIIAFSKAYGVAFLGNARSKRVAQASEVKRDMLRPLFICVLLIAAVGLLPVFFVKPLFLIAGSSLQLAYANTFGYTEAMLNIVFKISAVSFVLIAIVVGLYAIRKRVLAKRKVEFGSTWGCGYTSPTSKQQYTSSSYVGSFANLFNTVTSYTNDMKPIGEEEVFPAPRNFKGKGTDVVSNTFVRKPLAWLNKRFYRLAIFQTGKVNHYILYALAFMLLVFVLSYFDRL